ncbi:MAG: ABC transporter ATP-binding protein [Desulfohalobiaceae bacterium]
MSSQGPIYELAGISKSVPTPSEPLTILKSIDLVMDPGDSLAILGASGSGKTTLLHIMGSLDQPSNGRIIFQGQELNALKPAHKARLRNRSIGFVFQFHHLLPEFTTLENVARPARIAGIGRKEAEKRAALALDQVELSGRASHRVTTLSGGERQRTAIARAILMRPSVLLADEPTGNLDEASGERVGDLLTRLNRQLGMTLVVVTHNQRLGHKMDRVLQLHSGVLYENDPA